ncbi:hypothetical protein [Nodularia spumigena]|uniref:hypothetical protein n=1 Tax=Nodularia spumigena TaxID=70799 RepID=UPI002B20C350|nr:hypothetical protein [Nodularia spumigena]MEA5557863.1 hypothetical protein [Nodularia spumigena CH309]
MSFKTYFQVVEIIILLLEGFDNNPDATSLQEIKESLTSVLEETNKFKIDVLLNSGRELRVNNINSSSIQFDHI